MKQTRVANRYAKSLLSLAEEKGQLDAVYSDMVQVQEACDNRDLYNLLKSPIVKSDKKQSILSIVFASQMSEISSEFIKIITRKRREGALPEIAEEVVRQYKMMKNITVAEVTSAIPLSEEQKKQIIGMLHKETAGEIELVEKINKDLLGGFICRIGDRQIDASISRRITELRSEFSKNIYVPEL